MKIEEGKYYRTRDGRKVGPMGIWSSLREKLFDCEPEWFGEFWGKYGKHAGGKESNKEHLDLVAEWKEEPMNTHEETPVLWKDMTPEEKGALLLANHEGETIQFLSGSGWYDDRNFDPKFNPHLQYRVKPKEPKRETVCRYGSPQDGWWLTTLESSRDTHKITFDTIDGKPDCSSIKMGEI